MLSASRSRSSRGSIAPSLGSASRALVLASRQNNLSTDVREDETSSPARETRALPRILRRNVRLSLRAFFKRGWFSLQMREHFTGEMKRAGDQDWIQLCAGRFDCFGDRRNN